MTKFCIFHHTVQIGPIIGCCYLQTDG